MAIYFNNRILAPNAKGNSLEQRYAKELPEVQAVFDQFRKKGQKESTLVFRRDFKKVYNKKKTSWKPAPPISLPMVANIYLPDLGSVQIRYSKNPPVQVNGKLRYRDSDKMFGEITSVRDNEMDFAWFLLKATDYVEKGTLVLENKQHEFDSEFNTIKRQARASALLFSEVQTEEELHIVIDTLFRNGEVSKEGTVSELALNIWNKVQEGDKKKERYNYDSLYNALRKSFKSNERQEVIIADGNSVDGAEEDEDLSGVISHNGIMTAPKGVKKEALVMEAKSLGIDVDEENMTKDVIYTMIMKKREFTKA